MYLEDDSVDATIIPEILLVKVGMALHLDHARLVLVPTVPKNEQILEEKPWKKWLLVPTAPKKMYKFKKKKHWQYHCRKSLKESLNAEIKAEYPEQKNETEK
jgi:hypothetical protein